MRKYINLSLILMLSLVAIACGVRMGNYSMSSFGGKEPINESIAQFPERQKQIKKASPEQGFMSATVLFKDDQGSMWGLEDDAKNYVITDEFKYKGSRALKMEWDGKKGWTGFGIPWGGGKVNFKPYEWSAAIRYYVRSVKGTVKTPYVGMVLEDAKGTQIFFNMNNYMKDTLLTETWKEVLIPLEDLNAPERLDMGAVKQLMFNPGGKGSMVIDEVEIVKVPSKREALLAEIASRPLNRAFGFIESILYTENLETAYGFKANAERDFKQSTVAPANGKSHLSFEWKPSNEKLIASLGWKNWAIQDFSKIQETAQLNFQIRNIKGKEMPQVSVGFVDADSKIALVKLEAKYLEKGEMNESYQLVSIPISAFNFYANTLKPTNVRQLQFQFKGTGGIYVDDIVLSPLPSVNIEALAKAKTESDGKVNKKQNNANELDPIYTNGANVRIAWDTTYSRIKPEHWGFNDYEIANIENANDPEYLAFLRELKPKFIRLHWADMMQAYSNPKTRTWDVEKMKKCLTPFKEAIGDAEVMFNVTDWPKWLGEAPLPVEELEDEAAELCGELVRLMRDEVKFKVTYWELTNELDNRYENAKRLPDLWRLFNKMVIKVKQVDPTAKVGGPAFTWAKPEWVQGFFNNCAQNVDFLTYHNYASPSPDRYTDIELLNLNFSGMPNTIRPYREKFPNMKVFCTEYNIQWVWSPFEPRHANNVGACWQALFVRQMAESGIDGVNVWHLKGGSYGLIDGGNKLRQTGQLYLWGTKYLTGAIAKSSTGSNNLVAIPLIRPDGRSILLINKGDRSIKVNNPSNMVKSNMKVMRIDETGAKATVVENASNELTLPRFSLTLITDKQDL